MISIFCSQFFQNAKNRHDEHDSSPIIRSNEHLLLPIDSSRSKGREDYERVSSPIIGNDKRLLVSDCTNNNFPFSNVQTGEYFKNDTPIYGSLIILPKYFWEEFWVESLYEKAELMHLMLNSKNNIHFAF